MSYKRSDPIKNFSKVQVSTGYNAGATTITLTSGGGGQLTQWNGTDSFDLEWWDSTVYPDPTDDPNAEIVQVSNVVGDVLTVARGQQGTTATTKNTAGSTYRMQQAPTVKMLPIDLLKTSDGTVFNMNTTLAADADLKFSVGANEIWLFEFFIYWQSSDHTADIAFDLSGPAAPTSIIYGQTGFGPNANNVMTQSFSPANPLNQFNANYQAGVVNQNSFILSGSLQNGANAGTVNFRYAQLNSVNENLKILTGSRLRARKIP